MKKVLAFVLTIAILATGFATYFLKITGPYEKGSGEYEIVDIPKGTYLSSAAQILYEKNLVKNKLFFRLRAKIEDRESIRAGKYKIYRSSSNSDILEILNSGEAIDQSISVTIPEGFESYKIAQRLEEKGLVDSQEFMGFVENPSLFHENVGFLDEEIKSLEGFLFPDTYYFDLSESEEEIILKMLKRFEQVYSKDYEKRQAELGRSLNEIITMASIVEREAKVDSERDIVAAVFYNRLKLGRRLESCATVQYILGERKPNLTLADLEIDSPYNTYKHTGLPPSPIASPGRKSIEAALYPSDADYLYFVAKKDGSHAFSRTYKEHLKAKKRNLSE